MKKKRSECSPTIVGGQPAGKRDSRDRASRNIEQIVLKLASNESFRERFLEDRDRTTGEAGIVLSAEEKKILDSISDKELLAMAGVLAPGKEPSRRRFLRAAASLAALSGVGVLSCDGRGIGPETPVDGIRPDPVGGEGISSANMKPTPPPTSTPSSPTRGIQPDATREQSVRKDTSTSDVSPPVDAAEDEPVVMFGLRAPESEE
jgi:hypothetical protein